MKKPFSKRLISQAPQEGITQRSRAPEEALKGPAALGGGNAAIGLASTVRCPTCRYQRVDAASSAPPRRHRFVDTASLISTCRASNRRSLSTAHTPYFSGMPHAHLGQVAGCQEGGGGGGTIPSSVWSIRGCLLRQEQPTSSNTTQIPPAIESPVHVLPVALKYTEHKADSKPWLMDVGRSPSRVLVLSIMGMTTGLSKTANS